MTIVMMSVYDHVMATVHNHEMATFAEEEKQADYCFKNTRTSPRKFLCLTLTLTT